MLFYETIENLNCHGCRIRQNCHGCRIRQPIDKKHRQRYFIMCFEVLGFCISQVNLCTLGSHIFQDTVTRHPNMLVWSRCKLFYALKMFGII